MKRIFALSLLAVVGSATAQVPVSAWNFSGQTLNPFINCSQPYVNPLEFREGGDPTSPGGNVTFVTETVGSTTKDVALVPLNKLFRAWHGLPANGAGLYTNIYSIVMDVKFSNVVPGDWSSVYNTNDDNYNDGEAYVRWDGENSGVAYGAIGIGGNYGGTINEDQWYRLVITCDCTNFAGTEMKFYLDGILVHTLINGSGQDGRFSMYCKDDGYNINYCDLLADPTIYDSDASLSAAAFYDAVLRDSEVSALGGPGAPLPLPSTVTGSFVFQAWEGVVEDVPVTYQVRQDGAVVDEQIVTNIAGSYTFQTRASGEATISAKPSHWLRKSADVSLSTSPINWNIEFTNGDTDGDNEVNLVDFGRISTAFGSIEGDSNWDPNADLNGDGEVNLVDIGILSAGFGSSGDE